jgi:hypothetical protein
MDSRTRQGLTVKLQFNKSSAHKNSATSKTISGESGHVHSPLLDPPLVTLVVLVLGFPCVLLLPELEPLFLSNNLDAKSSPTPSLSRFWVSLIADVKVPKNNNDRLRRFGGRDDSVPAVVVTVAVLALLALTLAPDVAVTMSGGAIVATTASYSYYPVNDTADGSLKRVSISMKIDVWEEWLDTKGRKAVELSRGESAGLRVW